MAVLDEAARHVLRASMVLADTKLKGVDKTKALPKKKKKKKKKSYPKIYSWAALGNMIFRATEMYEYYTDYGL